MTGQLRINARGITREEILRVATGILDVAGLSGLAMRRIAAELGIQQSALYWHFENKQQLLAGLADRLLDDVPPPEGGEWYVRVTDLALALRSVLLRHRDGAELVATAFAFRLGARAPSVWFVDELLAAGLPSEDARTSASVLWHFVLGYTQSEQEHAFAAGLGAIEAETGSGRAFSTDRFLRGLAVIVAGTHAVRPLHLA